MKHTWFAATALAGTLATSPILAQQSQQPQDQQPENQQPQGQQQQGEQQGQQQQDTQQPMGQGGMQQQDTQQPMDQGGAQQQDTQQPTGQEGTQGQQQPTDQGGAQGQQQPAQEPAGALAGMGREELVGKELYSAQGDQIGKVEDVVMGDGGQVSAVLLHVGGFFGFFGKQVAVPAEELEMSADRLVTRNLTSDEVKGMPAYQASEMQQ